jgi:hypothetical protein
VFVRIGRVLNKLPIVYEFLQNAHKFRKLVSADAPNFFPNALSRHWRWSDGGDGLSDDCFRDWAHKSAGYQQLPNPSHWRAAPPIPALSPLREAFFDAMVFRTPNAAGLAASARQGAAVTCVTLHGVPNAPVAANLVP